MNITLRKNETMQDLVERLYESAVLVYGIAPVAYWYENLHENGRIKDIHFSNHMREKLGYKSTEDFPDDLDAFITFLHPDDVQPMLKNAIDAGTGKTDKYDLQYRIRRADGNYMWCHATGELVKDYKGTTVGMYGAFIDITEVVELREKALLDSLAEAYLSIYQVNLRTGAFQVLKLPDTVPKNYFDKNRSFFDNMVLWINEEIYPEDRAMALEACSIDYIKTQFETVRSYSVNIRHNRYNHRYREMRFVRAGDYEKTGDFFISFIDNHEYIMAQMAAEEQSFALAKQKADLQDEILLKEQLTEQMAIVMQLSDNFQAIFDVDTESGRYEIISYDNEYAESVVVKMEKGNCFYEDTYKDVEKIVCPEDRDVIRDAFSSREYIKTMLAEQGGFTIDYRLLMGGKPVWYRVRVAKKPGAEDHFLVGVFNINERKSKEEKRKKELEKALEIAETETRTTRALYDSISAKYDVMYKIALDPCMTEIIKGDEDAKKFFPIFDATTEDGLFRNLNNSYIDAVIHEDDRDAVRKIINKPNVHEQLRHSSEMNVTYRAKRNLTDYVYTEMSIIKAGEIHGELSAIIAAFKVVDAEVRKRLADEDALKNAYVMAQSANRAKTAFLNSMSHDIRTPMNAITGYTSMAKKHIGNSERVSEYLEKIDVSGRQLLELINQVLEMSRIESGKVVLQEEPADVIDRAYDMKTLSGTDIESKNLKYTVIIKDVPHRYVLADGSRMNQIILNIIGNAIKYTPEGGSIDYTVEEKPCDREGYGLYSFTVADTGIGMSEDFIGHIFEEFSRENTSTVSHIQGTGLGMPIVKKLVDLMDGDIDVKSEPGKGTTISVTVPMKWDVNAQSRAAEVAKHHNLEFKGKRLLLVEDNAMNREIATDILEDAGFAVECAEDGDVAVDMVRNNTYDAVLMDIQMPRMDGYEATKAIRALPEIKDAYLPIIALSANAFEEDRQKSMEAGMDAHVSKPIDILQLKETLAKYL